MRYSITYMRGGWGGSFSFFCCFSFYTITKKVKSKSLWVSEAWSWQKNIAKPEHSGRIWLCHCSRMCRLAIIQIIMRIRVGMQGTFSQKMNFTQKRRKMTVNEGIFCKHDRKKPENGEIFRVFPGIGWQALNFLHPWILHILSWGQFTSG